MGHLGGIVVAYLAVVVVVAVLAGIPQKVGGGLFRGLRWAIGFLQRDSWFARGMLMGVLAAMLMLVIWGDNPLPMRLLVPVLLGLGIVVILAEVSAAPRRYRWIQLGVVAAILVLVIWEDIPPPSLPVVLGLGIALALARVLVALWPDKDKKRSGAR